MDLLPQGWLSCLFSDIYTRSRFGLLSCFVTKGPNRGCGTFCGCRGLRPDLWGQSGSRFDATAHAKRERFVILCSHSRGHSCAVCLPYSRWLLCRTLFRMSPMALWIWDLVLPRQYILRIHIGCLHSNCLRRPTEPQLMKREHARRPPRRRLHRRPQMQLPTQRALSALHMRRSQMLYALQGMRIPLGGAVLVCCCWLPCVGAWCC